MSSVLDGLRVTRLTVIQEKMVALVASRLKMAMVQFLGMKDMKDSVYI